MRSCSLAQRCQNNKLLCIVYRIFRIHSIYGSAKIIKIDQNVIELYIQSNIDCANLLHIYCISLFGQ